MIYDLVIYNGTILTENETDDVIANGLICIKGARLARIESRPPDTPLPVAAETIDAAGGLIMPGLVNTHTHLPMTLFRGLADDLPLDTWLNEYIFPAENRHINPETVRVGTLLAIAEMLLSGTTTCCDGYFYEDVVAAAVEPTGLRALVGQGVIDFPAPGVPDPSRNLGTAADFLNHWKDRHPMITPSVFCHSPYTCSPSTLEATKTLAREAGVLFQIHVAETRSEAEQSQINHGLSPIAHLDRIGMLDKRTLLVHCVHLSQRDITTIKKNGAKISHNPESNMKLAAGVAPIPALLSAGVTVGLGTDGCASNNNLDLFGEMDTAAKLHKATSNDPTVLDAHRVLKMATIDGARAIGLGDTTGSIEIGKQADVIILDTKRPHLTPLYSPWSHVVYAARGSDVTYTVVAGKIVVADGCLKTMDIDNVLEDALKVSRQVLAK